MLRKTWKTGVRERSRLRGELFQELLERDVLVGVGFEGRGPRPAEQLAEVGLPERPVAQGEVVQEAADQPLDLGADAAGDRRAHDHVLLAGKGGRGGPGTPARRTMKRVAPSRRGEGGEPRREVRGEDVRHGGAAVGLHRRTRPVRGKVQDRGVRELPRQ